MLWGAAKHMSSIRVEVAYFAQARELAGTKEEQFVLAGPTTTDHLLSEVLNAHPNLKEIREVLRSLVNGQMVSKNIELKDGDRIALFPPVGGG
jgi:molybdopterin converting factor subunit 1